ncbi:MAG TPA: HAMP domain-containing sensor histidine kinase [Beijerinckiaceae bacterium]|nr:HAMP domain-containing sensor histidine kinase [Beijerinckiaceae bacterium]
MKLLDSLRGRLVASMLFVFALGLGGALALHPFEERGALLARYFASLVREPYQDLSVLLAFSVGAIALIWIVSGWSLRHLGDASREAALVGAESPGARISTARLPAEIRPLVDAVNGALDRLAEAYAAERRFVADAAHELRTPLAVLSLRLQRARQESPPDWAALDCDLGQVSRLVAQLLDLARKEYAAQTHSSDEDVANLSRAAREAVAAIIPLTEQAGRALDVDLPESLFVRGRADDLRDMIRNLLDNALQHGGGAIRIFGAESSSSAGERRAVITVSDEGRGVPANIQKAMFDRFKKETPNSAGSGLGLAIARQVAEGRRGSIEFISGPGCTVRVVLPIASAPEGVVQSRGE